MGIDDKNLAFVDENYKNAPGYFTAEFRESIIQKMIDCMWPAEVLLVGGGGTYKVKADKSV